MQEPEPFLPVLTAPVTFLNRWLSGTLEQPCWSIDNNVLKGKVFIRKGDGKPLFTRVEGIFCSSNRQNLKEHFEKAPVKKPFFDTQYKELSINDFDPYLLKQLADFERFYVKHSYSISDSSIKEII